MAFVKIVEIGSFTKAAEQLKYTQFSVSKMIADLEKLNTNPENEQSVDGDVNWLFFHI